MERGAPGKVAELDLGSLGWSYSVDFAEGLTAVHANVVPFRRLIHDLSHLAPDPL